MTLEQKYQLVRSQVWKSRNFGGCWIQLMGFLSAFRQDMMQKTRNA